MTQTRLQIMKKSVLQVGMFLLWAEILYLGSLLSKLV